MAALAALCKLHSASEQKLSAPVYSTLLDDFAGYKLLQLQTLLKFVLLWQWLMRRGSNQVIKIFHLGTLNCIEKTKNKSEKRPGMVQCINIKCIKVGSCLTELCVREKYSTK